MLNNTCVVLPLSLVMARMSSLLAGVQATPISRAFWVKLTMSESTVASYLRPRSPVSMGRGNEWSTRAMQPVLQCFGVSVREKGPVAMHRDFTLLLRKHRSTETPKHLPHRLTEAPTPPAHRSTVLLLPKHRNTSSNPNELTLDPDPGLLDLLHSCVGTAGTGSCGTHPPVSLASNGLEMGERSGLQHLLLHPHPRGVLPLFKYRFQIRQAPCQMTLP